MAQVPGGDGYYSNAYQQIQPKQSVVIPPRPPPQNLHERQAPHVCPLLPAHDSRESSRNRTLQVPPPTTRIPTDQDFFVLDPATGRHLPNADFLKTHFLNEGRLSHAHALFILEQTTAMMSREPNMLQVPGPVVGTPLTVPYVLRVLSLIVAFADHPSLRRHPWTVCESPPLLVAALV